MFHTMVNALLRSTAEHEFGDIIRRPPRGLVERNAQAEKIFWCSFEFGDYFNLADNITIKIV
jgi:hypothetical protein